MTRLIIDAKTNETTIQELSADELLDLSAAQSDADERAAEKIQRAEAKAALLTRLGITAEEATLLLS